MFEYCSHYTLPLHTGENYVQFIFLSETNSSFVIKTRFVRLKLTIGLRNREPCQPTRQHIKFIPFSRFIVLYIYIFFNHKMGKRTVLHDLSFEYNYTPTGNEGIQINWDPLRFLLWEFRAHFGHVWRLNNSLQAG